MGVNLPDLIALIKNCFYFRVDGVFVCTTPPQRRIIPEDFNKKQNKNNLEQYPLYLKSIRILIQVTLEDESLKLRRETPQLSKITTGFINCTVIHLEQFTNSNLRHSYEN